MSARPITFYFRGQCQQIEMLAPTTTVLQYLREYVSAEKTRQTEPKKAVQRATVGHVRWSLESW